MYLTPPMCAEMRQKLFLQKSHHKIYGQDC